MAVAILLAPFQPCYLSIALSTFVFFAAYHLYAAPYQALIPDLSPVHQQGWVQGFQTMMRGGGMFLGMVVTGVVAPVVVGMTIDAGEAAVDRARGYALIRSFAARALAVSLFFFRGVTARRGGADAFAEQDTRAG